MNKVAMLMVCAGILAGCNDDVEVFGIKLDSNADQLKKDGLVKRENLIPSKLHFLEIQINKAPDPLWVKLLSMW